jgi:hypothetical protein
VRGAGGGGGRRVESRQMRDKAEGKSKGHNGFNGGIKSINWLRANNHRESSP